MNTEVITKNYVLSNHFQEILKQKLVKLEKFVSPNAKVKINLSGVNSNRFTIEITVPYDKKLVRSEVTGDNMYNLVDIVLPKIEKQIEKYKTRQATKAKKSDKIVNVDKRDFAPKKDDEIGKIVKIKKFDISITTVEDAIAELELLDHNFYVFVNADSNKVSVVYKRNDGDYGLIVPEY